LISLYDKLNMLGDLKPSGLPEDYRKKVIQLLENKKDYNSLMNFANLIPLNERSATDWELLISSYDKLNMLGTLSHPICRRITVKKLFNYLRTRKIITA